MNFVEPSPTVISYQFVVPGEAVPWARVGGGKTVLRFTPKKQRSYEGVLKHFCREAMGESGGPLLGPIHLEVEAVYQQPKSWSKKQKEINWKWKTSKPDIDNLVKIVKDSLNTIAWRDDAQITQLSATKAFGPVPRLVVRFTLMDG